MGGVVFGAGQILEHHLPGVFQFLIREERSPEDVGVDRQSVGQLPGDHGPGKARMAHGDGLGPLHPGSLEILDDLPAAANASATEHHLARKRGQAAPAAAIVDGAGWSVEGHRHRFEAGELLPEQHNAVVERRRKKGLLHGHRG